MEMWTVPEIFQQVCGNLSQFDVLNLARVNHSFYDLAVAVLYRSITIDNNFSQFEKEYLNKNTTYIRSSSTFQLLLRTVGHERSCGKRTIFKALIKEIKVVSLPPEIYNFEQILYGSEHKSLLRNSQLNVLQLDCPLNYIIVKKLLHLDYLRQNLFSLRLNFNLFSHINVLEELVETDLKFRNLSSLLIGPFKNDQKVDLIFKLIKNQFKMETIKVESCLKLFRLSDLSNHLDSSHIPNLKISNGLFDDLLAFRNLRNLSLISLNFGLNLLLDENDCSPFKSDIFENLRFLELSNICLISNPYSEKSLMDILFENCSTCRLEYLKADVRSPMNDTMPNFLLNKIGENQLKELDFTIRHNSYHTSSLETLTDKYIKHGVLRQTKSLEKLSIEIKSERQLIDVEVQLKEHQFAKIINGDFPNLKSFRIQVHFDLILSFKREIFSNMKKLRNLSIVGSNAIPMHFGLGNMYPGVYDKWWRIIYLPRSLIENVDYNQLQYIKIDECLFVVDNGESEIVQPKASIDGIFEEMTRVSINNRL